MIQLYTPTVGCITSDLKLTNFPPALLSNWSIGLQCLLFRNIFKYGSRPMLAFFVFRGRLRVKDQGNYFTVEVDEIILTKSHRPVACHLLVPENM